MFRYPRSVASAIAVIGVPTSLGGHLSGMERTPGELRRRGGGGASGDRGPPLSHILGASVSVALCTPRSNERTKD